MRDCRKRGSGPSTWSKWIPPFSSYISSWTFLKHELFLFLYLQPHPFLPPKSPLLHVHDHPSSSSCVFLQPHSTPPWTSSFFLHFSKVPLTTDWGLLQIFSERLKYYMLIAVQGRKQQLNLRHYYCKIFKKMDIPSPAPEHFSWVLPTLFCCVLWAAPSFLPSYLRTTSKFTRSIIAASLPLK